MSTVMLLTNCAVRNACENIQWHQKNSESRNEIVQLVSCQLQRQEVCYRILVLKNVAYFPQILLKLVIKRKQNAEVFDIVYMLKIKGTIINKCTIRNNQLSL